MHNLDLLIEMAVVSAELSSGVPLTIVQSRTNLPLARIGEENVTKGKLPHWTEAEDRYLQENLGYIEEAEIARHLGRSLNSIHLRWSRDLHLPSPSKHPDFLTANRIARLLGEDVHKISSWIARGLLQGKILPGGRRIRRVRKEIFLAWLTMPENWIWFDVRKCRDPRLRRQIEAAQAAWGDEWWNTNQVAEFHGVHNSDVVRYIDAGKIQAVHAANRGGRGKNGWANWFVRKSEATRPGLVFVKKKTRGA